MKEILCPVDFSPAANNAIEYAAKLARETNGTLHFLHILPMPTLEEEVVSLNAGMDPSANNRRDEALKELSKIGKAVEEQFAIPCRMFVVSQTGSLAKALKEETNDKKYDLIVMGTGWADSLNEHFFGTHTYKVILKTKILLLAVPENCSFKKPERIVYATDYEKEDCKTLDKLISFTAGFHPDITVVHVSKKPTVVSREVYRCISDLLEDELDHPDVRFKQLVNEDASQALDAYMHESESDLLVLLTKKNNLLESVLKGSVTRDISHFAVYPVLVYHGGS